MTYPFAAKPNWCGPWPAIVLTGTSRYVNRWRKQSQAVSF